MSKLTNEQWKKIEEKLSFLPSFVKLKIDIYNITIEFKRISTTRNAYMIYVDNEFKFKWITEDCEERKRFLRPQSKYLYSSKTRNQKISKKDKKDIERILGIEIDKKITCYSPYWYSFGSLKNHLIKNNENIELVDDGS